MANKALMVLAFLSASWLCAHAQAQRPMQVDDLFRVEGIGRYYGGPYAFSPDGRALAFTRLRPKNTLINQKWFIWDNARGDVWLQSAPGQEPVNLTQGSKDGAGWWAPEWSPDGSRVAMLSTRADEKGVYNIRLWLWEKSSGQLRALTQRGLDMPVTHMRPYLWLDARHILCSVLPEGKRSDMLLREVKSQEIAIEGWAKSAAGRETSSSVLESGVPVDISKREQNELWVIDVTDGSHRVVTPTTTSSWQMAPGGKVLAFPRQVGIYVPKEDELIPRAATVAETIELQRLDGQAVKTSRPLPADVISTSLRWSPDGKELAFLSYTGSRNEGPKLYRVNVSTGAVRELALGDLDATPMDRFPRQMEWTANGELILLAIKRQEGKQPTVGARRDWWLVKADGSTRALTLGMKSAPPTQLWPQSGQGAFFGVAQGDVWRLTSAGKIENLTADFEPKVDEIVWPILTNSGDDQFQAPGATYGQIILAVRDAQARNYFHFDLNSAKAAPIKKPSAEADLVAFSPQSATTVFSAAGKDGTFIWRTSVRSGESQALMAANAFLKELSEGEFKSISYTSLQGEQLKAWLLLPVGYEPGKRYPLITSVYNGSVAGPQPSSSHSIASSGSLNMQIPAARGFAVLFPSMPLKPEGKGVTDDPMLKLPNGVLPAVDEVVRQGIADPDRLYLMGQSFGGFSTYGLVTQTKRFKAAAALAGISNWISLYGTYDPRVRYDDNAHERVFNQALMESSQVRLGNPPWKDLNRYIRNSPIFFVDRVETPLMIVQGDMDYVAIQQGEEFFSALYRQGKRAKFVRYWGEGHVLDSPANIRDMWEQILNWFNQFPERKP